MPRPDYHVSEDSAQALCGRPFEALRHILTNSVIEPGDENSATGVCYVLTILRVWRYEDGYRKVDGERLIVKREIIMAMGNSELGHATGLFRP